MTQTKQTEALAVQLFDGPTRRTVLMDHFPFLIGRSPECNLALAQSYVSRNHATITRDGTQFVLEDAQSRHGTFVNGDLVTRRTLLPGDRIQFGSREAPQLRVMCEDTSATTGADILSQLQGISAQHSDIEKLRWFLQAARELNSAGQVNRVLASLLETTLALARVERGYVFLTSPNGTLELALGRDAQGNTLTEAPTVSRTVMRQATRGTDQFIVTDTLSAEGEVPQSIVAHDIHTILCIPLRRTRHTRNGDGGDSADVAAGSQVLGALYLESRFRPGVVSEVDHELMRTIAREAAALVDIAQLANIEDHARKQQQELKIAARIQQGLMAVQIPAFRFAAVEAHSIACSDVGGDFFDVIPGEDALNVVLVDVSGKGISSAILASTLQGMLHVQLESGQPLEAIAAAIDRYLRQKNVGKYATMVLLRLHQDGTLEYLNCGHVMPRLCSDATVSRLEQSNLPVGLLAGAEYSAGAVALQPGWRIILVSDGITEAEDGQGELFGDDRLDSASLCTDVPGVLERMAEFCAGHPANDDCTIVRVVYSGADAASHVR